MHIGISVCKSNSVHPHLESLMLNIIPGTKGSFPSEKNPMFLPVSLSWAITGGRRMDVFGLSIFFLWSYYYCSC